MSRAGVSEEAVTALLSYQRCGALVMGTHTASNPTDKCGSMSVTTDPAFADSQLFVCVCVCVCVCRSVMCPEQV